MKRSFTLTVGGLILALAAAALNGCGYTGSAGVGSRAYTGEFHVVECGHSSPDTQYYAANVSDLERRGHNGIGLGLAWPRESGNTLGVATNSTKSLNWMAFSKERINDDVIEAAIADLKSVSSAHFSSNTIPIFTHPKSASRAMDWLDDEWWDVIAHNARQIGRVAKEGGCLGIMLDAEEYGYSFWSYRKLQEGGHIKDMTYGEVRAKARLRGREYAQALCSVFPDITVWTFFGHSADILGFDHAEKKGLEKPTPLLGAFLDGMLEGSTDEFILVDGQESAYGYTTRAEFEKGADVVRRRALSYTSVPRLYRQKVRVGFGLYIDASAYKSYYYNRVQPGQNYFSPGRLQRAIYWALRVGDGYVWTWSEKPVWWVDGPHGKPKPPATIANSNQTGIPQVYWAAVRRAFATPGTDASVPDDPTDPDPGVARYIRFPRPDEEDMWKPTPLPDMFEKIADLPTDDWLFRTDWQEQGEAQQWYQLDIDADGWRSIKIAEFYERQGVGYDGKAWYRRRIKTPRLPEDKKVYLFFGAVDESCWCYIDGRLVAWHDGNGDDIWDAPFALDVTGALPSDSTCTIVFRTLDRFRMGGIWKPVSIVTER